MHGLCSHTHDFAHACKKTPHVRTCTHTNTRARAHTQDFARSGSIDSSAIMAARGEANSWDYFLSHVQAESGPQVQMIANKLKALGFNPWFDQWDGHGTDGAHSLPT